MGRIQIIGSHRQGNTQSNIAVKNGVYFRILICESTLATPVICLDKEGTIAHPSSIEFEEKWRVLVEQTFPRVAVRLESWLPGDLRIVLRPDDNPYSIWAGGNDECEVLALRALADEPFVEYPLDAEEILTNRDAEENAKMLQRFHNHLTMFPDLRALFETMFMPKLRIDEDRQLLAEKIDWTQEISKAHEDLILHRENMLRKMEQ